MNYRLQRYFENVNNVNSGESNHDPTRFRILCLLRRSEVCVHEIVEALDVTQSAVSHQLRALRQTRLVTHRKVGRHVYYRLADEHVREMLENVLSHGEEVC